MHLLAERHILAGLKEGGWLQGEVDDMLEQRIAALFMPHGCATLLPSPVLSLLFSLLLHALLILGEPPSSQPSLPNVSHASGLWVPAPATTLPSFMPVKCTCLQQECGSSCPSSHSCICKQVCMCRNTVLSGSSNHSPS